MWPCEKKRALLSAFLVATFVFCAAASVSAGTYYADSKCKLPANISSGTRPNVMVILDYSGSMQFSAYHAYNESLGGFAYICKDTGCPQVWDGPTCCNQDTSADNVQYVHMLMPMATAYNPAVNYYGLFNSNSYYAYDGSAANKEYFYEANPAGQTISTRIISSAKGNSQGTQIKFTCATYPNLVVGNTVLLSGLNKHTALNGASFQVLTVSGNTFTITAAWNPPAQADTTGIVSSKIAANITKSEEGNAGTIWFTTDGTPGFAVNDVVVLSGLDSHKQLNGDAFIVKEVSGSRFKVTATWTGAGDTTGFVQKRFLGSFADAISGNVLNFYATTRIDAALKALIGGRAYCHSDGNCYLKGQGGRRALPESSILTAEFFMDPGNTLGIGSSSYPAYNKNEWFTGNYWDKTIFITVRDYQHFGSGSADQWTFTLTAAQSLVSFGLHPVSSSDAYCGIKVQVKSGSNWVDVTPDSKVKTSDPGWNDAKADWWNTAPKGYGHGHWEKANLPAGSYRVIAEADGGDYYLYGNLALAPGSTCSSCTATTSKIGNRADKRRMQMRVKVPSDERHGVLQDSFNDLRIGVMSYHGPTFSDDSLPCTGDCGQIVLGCDNTDLDKLVKAVQADTANVSGYDASTYKPRAPVGGTPTSGSIYEALRYFQQSSSQTGGLGNTVPSGANSGFMQRASEHDPYYDLDADGNPTFFPCRKSFVLLVSDGVPDQLYYSRSTRSKGNARDPALAAWKLHTTTLRSDADPTGWDKVPNAEAFTIFTFGGTDEMDFRGKKSMRATAMFGSFKDKTDCAANMPYSLEDFSLFDSKFIAFEDLKEKGDPDFNSSYGNPRSSCHASDTAAYAPCCSEWDRVWDRYGFGGVPDKGLPDNYFEADDGTKLERGLRAAMTSMAAATGGAGGAVATVYRDKEAPEGGQQQTTDYLGDLVVRGVYDANDPSPNLLERKYFWTGHLEAFWPYQITVDGELIDTYDFERDENFWKSTDAAVIAGTRQAGDCKLCIEIANRHCWDAGQVLMDSVGKDDGASRLIFVRKHTWDSDTSRPVAATDSDNLMCFPEGANSSWCPSQTDDDADMWRVLFNLPSGPQSTTEVSHLAKWVRGYDHKDTPANIWNQRDRSGWPLGDIVFSSPIIMGPPSSSAVSENDPDIASFNNFVTAQIAQHYPQVMYVGANDGMIHAFVLGEYIGTSQHYANNEAEGCRNCGKELWAFIPTAMLSELKTLADITYGTESGCKHRTMVDLSPKALHVMINGAWRTVIVGGLRGGGDTYFAMDVTDPYHPKLLWEYSVLKDLVAFDGTSYSKIPAVTAHYQDLKFLPVTWSKASLGRLNLGAIGLPTEDPNAEGQPATATPALTGNRHVVFLGGGFRIFDRKFEFADGSDPDGSVSAALRQPFLLALDVATGKNLFRYIWPYIQYEYSASFFPFITRNRDVYGIPYALTDPLLLDYLNQKPDGTFATETDGFVDHLLVGDANGVLYTFKFNLWDATNKGVLVDLRLTKGINEPTDPDWSRIWSTFRSKGSPVTVQPQAIREKDANDNFTGYYRIIFGAGKYDDVLVGQDDKTDPPKMSLYNVKDLVGGTYFDGDQPVYWAPNIGSCVTGQACEGSEIAGSGFTVRIRNRCDSIIDNACTRERTFNTGCTWMHSDGTADCCESECSSSCFRCLYDLKLPSALEAGEYSATGQPLRTTDTCEGLSPSKCSSLPGERMTSDALIVRLYYTPPAGSEHPELEGWYSFVFVTSYVPAADPCDHRGNGYLYAFNAQCDIIPRPYAEDVTFTPLSPVPFNGEAGGAYRVSLGSGEPSSPVLDSQGRFIFIQMSNRKIIKIELNPDFGKKGTGGPPEVVGWSERER